MRSISAEIGQQCGPVAQSVEQRTENPCVDSSILSWPTMKIKGLRRNTVPPFSLYLFFTAILPLLECLHTIFALYGDPDHIDGNGAADDFSSCRVLRSISIPHPMQRGRISDGPVIFIHFWPHPGYSDNRSCKPSVIPLLDVRHPHTDRPELPLYRQKTIIRLDPQPPADRAPTEV